MSGPEENYTLEIRVTDFPMVLRGLDRLIADAQRDGKDVTPFRRLGAHLIRQRIAQSGSTVVGLLPLGPADCGVVAVSLDDGAAWFHGFNKAGGGNG